MNNALWALMGALVGFGFFFFAYAQAPTWAQIGQRKATVLFVGDMMFDREVRVLAAANGEDALFACTKDLFDSSDFVVGNLEGPITSNASLSSGTTVGSPDNFIFTFPPSTAELLARHGIGAVDLGNNHIGNFGSAGIASTRGYLDAAGVGYFGGVAGEEPLYRTVIHGVPISFVSYNEFGGGWPAEVADTIASEHAQGRVVVVFAHWGEEYIDSSYRLRPIAELFVQNGAALIVGAHPHMVLPSEKIAGPDGARVPVYYSLGNFIFDQYWNDAVRTGLALEVTFTKNGAANVVEHLVYINRNGTTCPALKIL